MNIRCFGKIVSLILSLTMILVMVACSKSPGQESDEAKPDKSASTADSSPDESSKTKDDETEEKEHYTITMYHPLHPTHSLEDIPKSGFYIDNMYEEMFNIEFDIQYVPATNEEEVFNITMASGDIPDLVRAGNLDRLRKYADAWWDLNEFIVGKYANLEKHFFDDPYVHALSAEQNGQIKILSMLSEQFIGDVLLVRGDLVEEWEIDLSTVKTKED